MKQYNCIYNYFSFISEISSSKVAMSVSLASSVSTTVLQGTYMSIYINWQQLLPDLEMLFTSFAKILLA